MLRTRSGRKHTGTRRASAMPRALRERVKQESRAVGLTPRAYLDLVTRLAEAIRGAAFPEGVADAQPLRALLDNPLLLQGAAALAGAVWNTLKDSAAGPGDGAPAAEPEAAQADRPGRRPEQRPPGGGMPPAFAPGAETVYIVDPITGYRMPAGRRPAGAEAGTRPASTR